MFRFLLIALSNLLILQSNYAQSGFYQRNASITIGNGSTLYINGNYQTNADINNSGTIKVTGNLINEGSTGIFTNQNGTVILSGLTDQQITAINQWQFNQLILNKTSGNVILSCNVRVDSLLSFTGGNLNIGTYQIDLMNTGSLEGENENSRIYATSGVVKANRLIDRPSGTDDICGLGLYVHAPTEVFGVTYIIRGHQSIADAGAGSITRWFYLQPSMSKPTEYVDMRYFDNDGITDESRLQFFTKRPGSSLYFPKGGLANVLSNDVNSVYFRRLEEEQITLAPITDNSTCDTSALHYVEAVFLVPTNVTEDDTVYFVNLSLPAPDSINNLWNSGDGYSFNTEDAWHPYANHGSYNASLSVNNAFCSDASSKVIVVQPNVIRHTNSHVVSNMINSFIFYPNPVEHDLNWIIEFTDNYESNLVLLDVFGRIVFQTQYHLKNIEDHRDFSAIPAGLYLLKLEVMGKVYTYRVIKR